MQKLLILLCTYTTSLCFCQEGNTSVYIKLKRQVLWHFVLLLCAKIVFITSHLNCACAPIWGTGHQQASSQHLCSGQVSPTVPICFQISVPCISAPTPLSLFLGVRGQGLSCDVGCRISSVHSSNLFIQQ